MKKKCITLALLALFTTSLAACTTKVADNNKNDNDKSSDIIDGEPTDAGEGDGEGQSQGGGEGEGQGGNPQTEKVNVTFNANNGSANTTIQVNKGGKVTAPAAPTKDSDTYYNYTFTGWYRDQGLTQQFSFVNDVVNSDIVLYAGWKQSSM